MQSFQNKVAVVTGAANGIGRAIAERCAHEGMRVVLASINPDNLAVVERQLRAQGATVISMRADVSKRADVETLAQRTLETFGAVHLLVNNAGVVVSGPVWESSWEDWEWVLGVNLWGVIHGVKIFTPIMLAQETECHIVNVASISGLVAGQGLGVYKVTKHAVVSLTETLSHELAERGAKVRVSVLCPGPVNTLIADAERNRPAAMHNDPAARCSDREQAEQRLRALIAQGIPPEHVAACMFDAVRNERLYIITHSEQKVLVRRRMETILTE